MTADLYFIDKIGLRQNLSPTRSNGLLSMVRQMKLYAMAYNAMKANNQTFNIWTPAEQLEIETRIVDVLKSYFRSGDPCKYL